MVDVSLCLGVGLPSNTEVIMYKLPEWKICFSLRILLFRFSLSLWQHTCSQTQRLQHWFLYTTQKRYDERRGTILQCMNKERFHVHRHLLGWRTRPYSRRLFNILTRASQHSLKKTPAELILVHSRGSIQDSPLTLCSCRLLNDGKC